jgi:hypothetical protein
MFRSSPIPSVQGLCELGVVGCPVDSSPIPSVQGLCELGVVGCPVEKNAGEEAT